MKKSDKIKRFIAFYLSVIIFCVLLPIVLSYSLGYHVEYFPSFTIYKTGIIYLKSQPAGSSIYVNGKLRPEMTPAKIEELKPGTYRVEVKREGFYPWQKELVVRPNMVTKADSIVLFPLAQEIKRISDYEVVDFAVSGGNIYYLTKNGLMRSSMDGTGLKLFTSYAAWPGSIRGKKFSPDGNKIMYFDGWHIWVAYLLPEGGFAKAGRENGRVEEVYRSEDPIIDAFWYSESNHAVVVTERGIIVVDLAGGGAKNAVTLYTFNSRPAGIHYDPGTDSLYFSDLREEKDAKKGVYLYRMDLRQKFLDTFIKRIKKEFDVIYETK
ncbi:MAG: PEGA domain-containing protein [Candidatus Omnitrophica bacterium]|nr:PEGA domain-containing protein [Candidatus Omnitrophota bacterium]